MKIVRESFLIWLFIILFVIIVISSSIGAAGILPNESFRIIISKIPIVKSLVRQQWPYLHEAIIWKIRLPRIILAGLTGCGLAATGTCFQGVLKNPLADPHILGVSSGAALGATLGFFTGATGNMFGLGVIGTFAFIGAVITVILVYRISCVGNRLSTVNIVLTGTAVSSMLFAVISLLMTFRHDQIEKVYMWTLGSFTTASWEKAGFLGIFLLIILIMMGYYAKELDMISTGEEVAQSLGVDTARLRKHVLVGSSLLVAACVSVSGIIGFVGLVVPHVMRLLVGAGHKKLIPAACLGGACFMILCDTMGRTLAAPTEIPVGVITGLLGTPYFIFLLQRNKGRM